MRKSLLFILLVAVVVIACNNKTPEKPNIVFIFADDQCHNTIAALGNNEVITPNLDRMVESGVTFTHAYNMGAWNGAVCAASRAMLNTGRSVWRTYALEKTQKQVAEKGEMWGPLMKQAGYNTYITGKWHVRTSPTVLFDSVVHIRPGMPKDTWEHFKMVALFRDSVSKGLVDPNERMPFGYNRPLANTEDAWKPWDKANGGFWEGGKHWSEVLADDAIGFIQDAKTKDEPFFMYLAFNAPHDPRQAPKEFYDMYSVDDIAVPETFAPEYPNQDAIGCGQALRDAALAPFPRTELAAKIHRKEYYALITHLDQQIGKILDELEKLGKMDNTYIFYTADHGLAVGDHGLFGKQNMHDHSIRPPLLVIGPDVPKNKKLDMDVYLQDIMASSIDLAGLPKPDYIEFNSLMPFVRGSKKESYYDAIYGAYKPDMQRMIRKDGFKLIVYPQPKVMRLYDMENDPLEMNDLINDPKYQAKKDELFKALIKLQKDMDDPLDLTAIF